MPGGESLLDSIFSQGGEDSTGFLKALSNDKLEGLLVHSELPPPAVLDFATLLVFADRMNSKVLKAWARRFLQSEVIKDRKRALELVELFQSYRSRMAEGGDE
jgi:hypothetical protein